MKNDAQIQSLFAAQSENADLPLKPIGDERAKVTAELRCRVTAEGEEFYVVVPEGFETDFASTPKQLHTGFLFFALAIQWLGQCPLLGWFHLDLAGNAIANSAILAVTIILRRLVPPPFGLHAVAAVFHDYVYRTKKYPKAIADLVFYVVMRQWGVPKWRAEMMFRLVWVFGWITWIRTESGRLRSLLAAAAKRDAP